MSKRPAAPKVSYAHLFHTLPVLFEKLGENQTTAPDPRRPYNAETDERLLSQEITVCVSHDNDMLVKVRRYQVHNVTIPVWMTGEEFCARYVEYTFAWGLGIDPRWPESWQRSLVGLTQEQKYIAGQLLGSNLRSEFRKAAALRIVEWISTAPENRKYASPLSGRHWNSLISGHGIRECKQIAESIYWSKSTPRIGLANGGEFYGALRGIGAEHVHGVDQAPVPAAA